MSHAQDHHITPPLPPTVTPWALRAWPPLLWQAQTDLSVRFHHIGTRVVFSGDPLYPPAGQTIWAAHAGEGEAGMAWDWVQIAAGVVAIADPMSVVTNLRLVSGGGEVLTAHEAALLLNEWVRTLPWQCEVQRALQRCND
jgi:hypothetical protein